MYRDGASKKVIKIKDQVFMNVAAVFKEAMERIEPPHWLWQQIKEKIEAENEEVSYRLLKT